jgi:hypothetical protein
MLPAGRLLLDSALRSPPSQLLPITDRRCELGSRALSRKRVACGDSCIGVVEGMSPQLPRGARRFRPPPRSSYPGHPRQAAHSSLDRKLPCYLRSECSALMRPEEIGGHRGSELWAPMESPMGGPETEDDVLTERLGLEVALPSINSTPQSSRVSAVASRGRCGGHGVGMPERHLQGRVKDSVVVERSSECHPEHS